MFNNSLVCDALQQLLELTLSQVLNIVIGVKQFIA